MRAVSGNAGYRLLKAITRGVAVLNNPTVDRAFLYFETEEIGRADNFLSANRVPDKPFVCVEASAKAIINSEDGIITIAPGRMSNKLRIYIDLDKVEEKLKRREYKFLFLIYVNIGSSIPSPLMLPF